MLFKASKYSCLSCAPFWRRSKSILRWDLTDLRSLFLMTNLVKVSPLQLTHLSFFLTRTPNLSKMSMISGATTPYMIHQHHHRHFAILALSFAINTAVSLVQFHRNHNRSHHHTCPTIHNQHTSFIGKVSSSITITTTHSNHRHHQSYHRCLPQDVFACHRCVRFCWCWSAS